MARNIDDLDPAAALDFSDDFMVAQGTSIDLLRAPLSALKTLLKGNEVYAEYATNEDITAVIAADDSIPQVGEGTEILSVALTPRFTNSIVEVSFNGWASQTTAAQHMVVALFINGAADAVQATLFRAIGINYQHPMPLLYRHVPGVTTAMTYSIRAGVSANTMRFNGTSAARLLGGSAKAVLRAREIFQ